MKYALFTKLLLISFLVSAQNIAILKGVVKNIDKDTLIIAKYSQDCRYNGIEIPVRNNIPFNYKLEYKFIEEYAIAYKSDIKKGSWKSIKFFPNGGTLYFELYPENQYNKNKIIGDELGEKQNQYYKVFSKKFMRVGNEIFEKILQLKKGSKEYNKVKFRLDSLNREILNFQKKYFSNDKPILGLNEYAKLLENANRMMISKELLKEYQAYYVQKGKNHPLVNRIINLYNLLNGIKVNDNYIDIKLKDYNDVSIHLSDLIKDKQYTILDLWSPWCGSCLKKSNLLKENYHKIIANTQIIGIVGGVKTDIDAKRAIRKMHYPWKNYLEISIKNEIWEKYGIEKSGGIQLLINNKGIILAINPTIQELINIITEKQ